MPVLRKPERLIPSRQQTGVALASLSSPVIPTNLKNSMGDLFHNEAFSSSEGSLPTLFLIFQIYEPVKHGFKTSKRGG